MQDQPYAIALQGLMATISSLDSRLGSFVYTKKEIKQLDEAADLLAWPEDRRWWR